MNVGDILRHKGSRVATIRMNETVDIAAKLLRRENVGALVVKDVCRTEGNTVVGMFSERDVARAIADHGAACASLPVSKLIEVQKLITCTAQDSIEHVRMLMDEHHIRHLPVLEGHSLIGVISMRDINTVAVATASTAAAAAAAPAVDARNYMN